MAPAALRQAPRWFYGLAAAAAAVVAVGCSAAVVIAAEDDEKSDDDEPYALVVENVAKAVIHSISSNFGHSWVPV